MPPSKEPLLSALGGFPFALKTHLENELEALQAAGVKPLFVFTGLDFAVKSQPSKQLSRAARLNAEAWELYNQHQAVQAVETFGNSGRTGFVLLCGRFLMGCRFDQPEDAVSVLSEDLARE